MIEKSPPLPLAPLREALAAVFEPDRLEQELAECEVTIKAAEPDLLKRIGAGESQAGLQLVMDRFKREALPVERDKLKQQRIDARAEVLRVENEIEARLIAAGQALQKAKSEEMAAVVRPVAAPLLYDGAAPDFGYLASFTSDWRSAARLLSEIDLLQRDYPQSVLKDTHPNPEYSPLIRKVRRLIEIGEEFFGR